MTHSLTHSQTIKNSATQLLRSWRGAFATQRFFVFVETTLITPLCSQETVTRPTTTTSTTYRREVTESAGVSLVEHFPSCHKATNPHLTRYGLYDYEYEHQCQGTTESSKKQKLFLMAWCPDSAKIKKKMLYSSSFDALKKSLVGVHKFIQVTILLIFLKIFCYLK